MITTELSSFHDVCFKEKIQVIVWPHNQGFTKLAARGASYMFHVLLLKFICVLFHLSKHSYVSFDTKALVIGFSVFVWCMRFM